MSAMRDHKVGFTRDPNLLQHITGTIKDIIELGLLVVLQTLAMLSEEPEPSEIPT